MTNIYTAEAIKMAAVSSFPDEAWTSLSGKDAEAEELRKQVAWLRAVQAKRAAAVTGLPIELQRNGEKVEKADWPVRMDMPELLTRYSMAMDLFGQNYMFQIKRGDTVESIRWFRPSTITAEVNARQGLVGFTRTLGANKTMYPIKDGKCRVMWTWLPGMDEDKPDAPPADTVLDAANILRYMSETVRGLFEDGAIDSWVLFSPRITGIAENDKKQFMGYLKRILKRGVKKSSGEIWTLDPDSRIESMNAPIDEWALPELNDMKAEEIAIAHDTPLMLLRPNEGADKAMMEQTRLMWINEVIIPHGQRMIDTLNEQLFYDLGYEFVILSESLNINQEEEVQRSQAVGNLVMAGETLANAYAILGYDLPPGYVAPPERLLLPAPEPEAGPEIDNQMKQADMKAFRNWIKKRLGADVDGFNSNELTRADKMAIAYEVGIAQGAPFRNDNDSAKEDYP
jgi:hypothetical protein